MDYIEIISVDLLYTKHACHPPLHVAVPFRLQILNIYDMLTSFPSHKPFNMSFLQKCNCFFIVSKSSGNTTKILHTKFNDFSNEEEPFKAKFG